ncbi:MAG: LuxR C-terminal-related transcriptional regulator [Verrucomicrobiota bacterium]
MRWRGAPASGCRYKEVADRPGVSHKTIRSHGRRIFEKLQAQAVVEAVRRARGAGIRQPD